MLEIGSPIQIDGQEVILLADLISANEPGNGNFAGIGAAPDGFSRLWLDENEISTVRESYPDTPIYGFWQLVFHNRLAELSEPIQVFPLDSSSGFFLQVEDDRIVEAGQYRGREIVELGRAVADLPSVELHDDELLLPPLPAMLASEIGAQARRVRRQQYIRWVCIAVVGVAVVGGLKYVETWRVEQIRSNVADLQAREHTITQALQHLQLTRNVPGKVPPGEGRDIDRVLELAYRADFIELKNTRFDTARWRVRLDDHSDLPAWAKGAKVIPEPTNTLIVSWEGSGA